MGYLRRFPVMTVAEHICLIIIAHPYYSRRQSPRLTSTKAQPVTCYVDPAQPTDQPCRLNLLANAPTLSKLYHHAPFSPYRHPRRLPSSPALHPPRSPHAAPAPPTLSKLYQVP
jgi:hypothetical protein